MSTEVLKETTEEAIAAFVQRDTTCVYCDEPIIAGSEAVELLSDRRQIFHNECLPRLAQERGISINILPGPPLTRWD